ncbi:unnamed protein product [Polarella glacialis]|uniref:Uncharacterized protein n=1 Tax=Polarella glacialis TaxID=89957 RepID=A0A813GMC8_POLGL|nr:unnamed protein product [Polarella glacialis]
MSLSPGWKMFSNCHHFFRMATAVLSAVICVITCVFFGSKRWPEGNDALPTFQFLTSRKRSSFPSQRLPFQKQSLNVFEEAKGASGLAFRLQKFEQVLNDIWSSSSPRYLVWRDAGAGDGWGNQVRSITSAMLLSLITQRRLLIDHDQLFEVFSNPYTGNATWNYREEAAQTGRWRERLLPLDLFSLVSSSRSDTEVVILKCNCYFALDLLHAPEDQIRDPLQIIFGSDREDTISEIIIRFLFSRPRIELLANALQVLRSWDRELHDGFAMIQSRQWVDLHSSSRPPILDNTTCMSEMLSTFKQGLPGQKRLLIAVTSDSVAYSKVLSKKLSHLGSVGTNTLFPDNTHSASRFLTKYARSQAIIDWYLLGEAQFVICTRSTYCISARARLGFGNNGSFPFRSERRTYQHGGPSCTGVHELAGWRGLDTLTDPTSGRVWW